MATLSLFDKLNMILELTLNSKLFIFAILFIVFLAIVLFTTNFKNAKTSRRLLLAIYLFIMVASFVMYKNSLSFMWEYLMNNLFMVIYFPNLAVYLAAIVLANIILWVSVFNFKTSKFIKSTNIIVYSIINYLLITLLTIINKYELDVFNQKSIYGNTSAQAVIELSSMLFIVWIIFLCLYKFIRIFQTRNNKPIKNKRPNKPTKVVIKQQPNRTTKPIEVKRKLPENIREIQTPKVMKKVSTPTQRDSKVKKMSQEEKLIKQLDSVLTLDDYKLLLNILKERKERDRLERERKLREEKELEKFRKLQDLYSVR